MTIKTSLGRKEPEMTLPFALSGIEVENFQGIHHLKIANISLNTQWIFLTGENSFGKTSILRSTALGLPKLLSELFPKIQFIATTHSPLPILGLPQSIPYSVFTVSRTADKGITADRKDDNIGFRRSILSNLNSFIIDNQFFGFDLPNKEIMAKAVDDFYKSAV